jgi:hypothetical protein
MVSSWFQKIALLLAPVVFCLSFEASAQFMGVEAGIRQQSAESNTAGVSTSTEMAYQFGLVGAFPMTEKILFRSGFLYTQRPITVKVAGLDSKYTYNYFDIPLTILWKLNDFGGVYGGVNLALAASADCTNCGSASPNKAGAMPLVVGGTFKFAPSFGVDVYYEAMAKVGDDFKEARAVGANLLITFD